MSEELKPIDYNPFIKIHNEASARDAIKMAGFPVFLQSIGFILIGGMNAISPNVPYLPILFVGLIMLFGSILIRRGNIQIALPLAIVSLFVTIVAIYVTVFISSNLREIIGMAMSVFASLYSINAFRGWNWIKQNA